MNTSEVADLIRNARNGATSSEMDIGDLLRICMRLGSQLSNKELVDWARSEASGYTENEQLPDYRLLNAEARGNFLGPFQSGYKNAQIPKGVIEERHRKRLFTVELREPASQIEQYANKNNKKSNFAKVWPADIVAYYQKPDTIYSNNMSLAEAWNPISLYAFGGIIETIRTRVLDFMLKIEAELGFDIEEPPAKEPEHPISPKQVTHIFNNTIYGQNVAISNTGEAKSISIIVEGDKDSLLSYLKSLGINKTDISSLNSAIDKDPGNPINTLGPKVSEWLSKITIKSIKGGLSVSKDVGVALIAEAIMRFYNIK